MKKNLRAVVPEVAQGGFSLVPIGEESTPVAAPATARRAPGLPAAARIRDRYILARFPGVMGKSADLADTDAVIVAARLYFEDGLAARGVELLQFAAQMDPMRESLWLARLQMHFLLRDATGFADAARRMQEFHSRSAQWPRIATMGLHLGLAQAFITSLGATARPESKPGTWPELPDWLQSPRDHVPVVAAAQMRSRLLVATECGKPQPQSKEAA